MLKNTHTDPFTISSEKMNLDIQNIYKEFSPLDREIQDSITQYSFDICRLNTKLKAMIDNKFIISDYNGNGSFKLHDLFRTTLIEDKFIILEYSSNSFYLKSNWLNEEFKKFSFRVLEPSNINNYQQRDNKSEEDHFFVQLPSEDRNRKTFAILIKDYIEKNLISIQELYGKEISEAINRTYYLAKLLYPIGVYNKNSLDNPLDIKSIFTSYENAPINTYPELIKELEDIIPLLELSYDIDIRSQLKDLKNNIQTKPFLGNKKKAT